MSFTDFTEELLGIQDVIVEKVKTIQNIKYIYLSLKRKEQECPCCHKYSNCIHDYRTQKVKDCKAFDKNTILILRKRRYHCPHCGKNFYPELSFLPRYYRMTQRMIATIIDDLRDNISFTHEAKKMNVSVNTIIRIFDVVDYSKPVLHTSIAIDEFKGNTGGEKYNAIITDPVNHQVLDILPKRYDYYLAQYFREYPKEDKRNVDLFISDMWKPYYDTADYFFPKAMKVIDKYHWERQMTWAFERIRKKEQKHLSPGLRKYFKHSKKLLLSRQNKLTFEEHKQVEYMRAISIPIDSAYSYLQSFYEMFDCKDKQLQKLKFIQWIMDANKAEQIDIRKCADTFYNWKDGILNSLLTPYTNGFTEGCNNKIKVLKRNAYGYRNFKRFRNRILHIFSHQLNRKTA